QCRYTSVALTVILSSNAIRSCFTTQPQTHHPPRAPVNTPTSDPAQPLTITIISQVKAGKSSVINALLGEQQAQTDVLPMTSEITRYQLQPPGIPARFVLLDTVGYGHTGPKEDQLRATQEAAQHSNLVCLVLHARNPA